MTAWNFPLIGACAACLSMLVFFVASAFHGGHNPADLSAVLPEYASNPYWKAVHLGQFFGFLLMTGGLVALYGALKKQPGAALAHVGVMTALVATSTYAANQAVDGVAIQYVAQAWVHAIPAERPLAFRLAETVRHVEQGLSSMTALSLGITLLLYELALIVGKVYAKWLGYGALVVGSGYITSGLLLAASGFSHHVFTFWVGNLLILWVFAMAATLWRKGHGAVVAERIHREVQQ